MCTGSKGKACSGDMAGQGFISSSSDLLEFSASDDISAFVTVAEKEGHRIDEVSVWYGRRIGSKEMGFEERTPLMIASMFGSKRVVNYLLEKGGIDVNRACGSDGATALHCAVAGGSASSDEIARLLIESSADVNSVDANGKRPSDLIGQVRNYSSFNSRRKTLESMLNGGISVDYSSESSSSDDQRVSSPVPEKKEYPVDPSLPDIKNGIYGTDEFRMYTFKVKPCSRAYSHDWTECPFVHPGENARRRDPRKYHYSCVPCPDFRRSACQRGDTCEYAHGIFECWLHPAQYRTRLCKDETNCARRVCFFAHRIEELRPLYASTGSAVPSPRSYSNGGGGGASSMDISSITPPMSPAGAGSSSPNGGSLWNQANFAPPTLHLPGSRLKSALNARDIDLFRRQQVDDLSWLSSPSSRGLKPTNLDDIFGGTGGSIESSSILPQFQGLSLDSPNGSLQMRQNMIRTSSPSFVNDPSGSSVAGLNSRSAAFAKRSQSFIDRSPVNRGPGISSRDLSDWSSPDGKLDWGIQKEEINKLRKSASFGLRNNVSNFATTSVGNNLGSTVEFDEEEHHRQYFLNNNGGSEVLPSWVDQFYMDQEQILA